MADVHQQIDHLKTQIDTGAEETQQYLCKLKKKVEEYDAQYKLSETATAYLQSGIDTTSASVDELKHIGSQLQKQSKTASRETISTAQHALGKVKDSLDGLQGKAREFDRKFASSTGTDVAAGVENMVNAARQRTTDAIEMANEQAMRVLELVQNVASNVAGGTKHTAQVATGEAVKAAEMVDEKLGVTPKVSSVAGGVTEKVKSLDRRMHVTETAAKIDSKITGGLGANLVHKGVEMVQESIDYVTETLQHAKLVANKSETAQAAEQRASGAADKVAETAGAAQKKAVAAKDQAQDVAGQARDKTVEMASSAKESAMDATGMSGGGPSMVDKAKDTAGKAGDMASERATQVKEGAQDMAGQAMDKGHDIKEGVQQKGSQAMDKGADVVDAAKQKGTDAVEGAKQTGSKAMEKGSDAVDAAKAKGSAAMDTAKDKGSQAVDTTKEKGSQAKQAGSEMMGKAQAKGSQAKEAAMGSSSTTESQTSVGDDELTQQAAKSAIQATEQAKQKMDDVEARQKTVLKEA